MKIKKYITVMFFLFMVTNVLSQNYTHSLNGIKKVKIESVSGIILKTHSKNELLISTSENMTLEKTKGLYSIYSNGTDNTRFGFQVEVVEGILIVKDLKKDTSPISIVYLPTSMNIFIESLSHRSITVIGFQSEIEAKTTTGKIQMIDVTGSIIAESRTGEITVKFSSLSQSSPTSIISSTGNINVDLKPNDPANLTLKASKGDIYSSFKLSPQIDRKKQKNSWNENDEVNVKINGGGIKLYIYTFTGNIYLKKRE